MSDKYFQDLLQKASKGDPSSQLDIALIFLYGSEAKYINLKLLKPIKKNLEEGFKWIKLAAEQENTEAELYLGNLLYTGEGVEKDFNQSFKWIELAAKGGNSTAQNNLGYYYENGIGVDANLKEAKSWYQLSFNNGYRLAYFGIDDVSRKQVKHEKNYTEIKKVIKLLNQTSPDTKSSFVVKPKKYIDEKYKEAFDLTYKVANSSKPIWFSYILLASMYLNGVGVAKNWENAYQWLYDAYEDLSDLISSNPFSKINKFENRLDKQVKSRKISVDSYLIKINNFEDSFFQNIVLLNSIWNNKIDRKNTNFIELILRKSMILCPEKSVQIEAFTNYENGKQVLFTQQRLNVPPIIARRGPYFDNIEAEEVESSFLSSFYESTDGFGGMTDSEKDMF